MTYSPDRKIHRILYERPCVYVSITYKVRHKLWFNVPANQLRNILVNGDADIRSLYTLQIPGPDVIFNGACHCEITSVGELNLIETEKFTVEAERKVRQIPASYSKNKKY